MAEFVVFGVLDYAIIVATMIGSVLIGVYFRLSGGKQKTNEEYLYADKNMSIFPVAVSLMASFVSAISLLGGASENYFYGMQFVAINIAVGLVMPVSCYFYLPVFFGLQKTSTYEYLELRFGPQIRILASFTYTLQMVMYNGIVLYAPAIVIQSVTGLNSVVSILVVGLACTFYSSLGGMKAVLFTDVLQSVLMYLSVLSIVIFATVQLGVLIKYLYWPKKVVDSTFRSNFSLDPTVRHTWWSLVVGGFFTNLSLYGVNHTQVQRLLTVSTLSRSQQCLWWSWPVIVILNVTTCFGGLAIYAAYKQCDPLTAGLITATDQIMPYYVVDVMRVVPGLAGLFVAGIFSACLSTISASCNALAAVYVSDYLGRWCKLNSAYVPLLTKLAACGFGLLFLALAFLAQYLGGLLQAALTIFGAVGGPLLGVFTLGMFTTFANEKGASVGLITGLALTLWTSFGSPRPPIIKLPLSVEGCAQNISSPIVPETDDSQYFYLYRISYMWTSMIGFFWVLIIGSVVSLIWIQEQPWHKVGATHPDPALFTPLLAKYLKRKHTKGNLQSKTS